MRSAYPILSGIDPLSVGRLALSVAVMLALNGLTAASAAETPKDLRSYPGYENSNFKNLNFPGHEEMDPETIGVDGGETSLVRNQFDTNLSCYERSFASLGKSGNTYGVLELFPGAHLKVTGRLINQGLVWLQSGSVLEVGSYISDKGEMGLVFLDGADKGTSLIVNGDFYEVPESSMTHHFVVLDDEEQVTGYENLGGLSAQNISLDGNAYLSGSVKIEAAGTLSTGEVLLKGNSTAPYFVLTAGEKLNVEKIINNYAGAHLVLSAPTAVIETLIVDGENKNNPATLEISKNSQRTGTQSLTIDALSLQNNSELSIESGVSLTLNSEVTSDHSGGVIAVADGGVLNFEDLDGAEIDAMLDIDAGAVLNVVRGIWTITDGGFNSDRRMQLDGTLVIGGDTSQSASLTVTHGIEGSGSGEIRLVNGGSLNLSSSSYALSMELKTDITVESGANVSVNGSWSVAEGNTLMLQDGSTLSVTGGLTTQLQTENGRLTMAGGRLTLLDGSNAKLSYLTIKPGENSLTIKDGVLELPGSLTVDGGVLETTVSDNGTLRITIGSIDFYPGNFTVGGKDAAATLEFTTTSGTLSTSLFAPETGRFVDEGNAIFKIGQLMLTDGGSLSLKDSSAFEVDSLTLRGDLAFGSGQIRLSGAGSGSELAGDKLTLGIEGSSGKAVLLLGDNDADGSGGTLSTDVTAVNGSIAVRAGTWNLAGGKKLAVENGSLTVGGQNSATLIIDSGAVLASAADGNGSDEGINVLASGILEADASSLFTIDSYTGEVALVSGLHKICVDDYGLLRINLDSDISYTVYANLAQSIKSGKGLIEYVGGVVQFGSREADSLLGSDSYAGAIYQNTTSMATAVDGKVSLVGGYGAYDVQIANDCPGDIERVTISDYLTLVGEGALMSAKDSASADISIGEIAIADGKSLNLGYTGYADKTGYLNSNIVLGTDDGSGRLVAYGGQYTVKSILAKQDGMGTVSATQGAWLTVEGDIGSNGSAVGEIAVGEKGSITVEGGIWTQAVTLEGGYLSADYLKAKGDVFVGTDTDKEGSTLQVLSALGLNGHVLRVDPDWGETASNVAVRSINDELSEEDIRINGGVAVGRNSYAAIGTSDLTWLPAVSADLSQDKVNAVLGIYRPISICSGSKLFVNGALAGDELYNGVNGAYDNAAGNSATFAAGSLLVINGADPLLLSGTPAINFEADTGTILTVENEAKLLLADAVGGQMYTIIADVDNLATAFNGAAYGDSGSTGWRGVNLMADSPTIEVVSKYDGTAGAFVIATQTRTASKAFPGLSSEMAGAVDDLYAAHTDPNSGLIWSYADVYSAETGVRLLSRATNILFLANDVEVAVRTIESAARMVHAGAVPQMAKMASDVGINAVVSRFSLVNPVNGMQSADVEGRPADRNALGFALWVTPTWQNRTDRNLEAGYLDGGFSGNIGGVAFGADYTFENAVRAGIAVNVGTGYAHSKGDYSHTTNHMDYWGFGVYAGYKSDNFALLADAGFTGSSNELRQDLDASMNMANLDGDVRAEVWYAGLRAEYKFETDAFDVIPHVGARYQNLHSRSYNIKSGGTALEAGGMSQRIWTFPFGVTFSKNSETSDGWLVRPFLDFTVIPAAGDVKARQSVHFTGLPGSYKVGTQTMDHLTWRGGAGVEIDGKNLSVGVNYTLQAGQTSTGHGLFATLRYKF